MISNFIFSRWFRVVRNDDIGHIAHRPTFVDVTPKKDKCVWYTCIEKYNINDKKGVIHGFDCMKCDTYIEAEKEKINAVSRNLNIGLRKTIIPVCKWVPSFLHSHVVNYKLKNKYWKNNIEIYKKE